nr:ABC transporter permease [uncultured Rhodococcus sp.]
MVVVLAVGIAVGFRPNASPVQWISVSAMVILIAFAISWLAVAMGMASKSVETASNLPMLLLLPFLGSGFVPTDTMPSGLR